MDIDLDKLEQMAKAITPLPWEVTDKGYLYVTDANPNREIARILMRPKDYNANAAYIVAACNVFPDLSRRVRELEAQRDYLAKLLGDLCTAQKDGQCPLFYACPAAQFGWSCGNAIKENWIYAAEKAEEGDGE